MLPHKKETELVTATSEQLHIGYTLIWYVVVKERSITLVLAYSSPALLE